MEKVLEILNEHEFKKHVMKCCMGAKVANVSHTSDEELILSAAKHNIKYLINHTLTNEEGNALIDVCIELLAKEVLKELKIDKIEGELTDTEKAGAMLAALFTVLK